jgi:hypothetical protein
MSTPTDSPQDELRALRARAYGPDADISDDPIALARLVELEDRERAADAAVREASSPVVDEPMDAADPGLRSGPEHAPPFAPAPVAPAVAAMPGAGETLDATASPVDGSPGGGIPDPDPTPDAATAAASATATRRPWWRRARVLWAASVVAALLAGAGLALWLQSVDSGHVAVLHPEPDAAWPTELWGSPTEGSRTFTPFHGMSVLVQLQDSGVEGQDRVPCLTVFSAVKGTINYGGGACGAGPFPASAAFVISAQSPKELREAFSEGTALQFVLVGDEVHVYAKGPGFRRPTP